MNWKLIALGIVVVLILGSLGTIYYRGKRAWASGFANPAPTANSFTMYYADWCPHCQTAKPDFSALVEKGDVVVGSKRCAIRMVNSEKEAEKMKGKDVKGFPTFLLETTEGETVEYKGPRSTDGYLKFINEKLGGGI
jgi:thiol-disulfide isomerase/thioredoxin